jgi:hypothetical protein
MVQGAGQNVPFPGGLMDSTDGHVRVPGTRLSMIPPEQFALTHSFTGLLKMDGTAVIQVYDLADGNFYADGLSFTKEQFEKKGAKVLVIRDIKVDGFPAKFCYMEGDSAKRILALVFGDSTFSTTLIGLYPDTATSTGQTIRDAFASISYNKSQIISPFETAPFRLDTIASPFRFAEYNKPIFIYSLDGKEPLQGKPFVTITPYPRKEGATLQDISERLIVKDMQHGLTDPDLENMSMDSVNGMEAYEVEIYCQLGGQKGVLYQFITSGNGKTIVVEGVANGAFVDNIKSFKALAHTIKIL